MTEEPNSPSQLPESPLQDRTSSAPPAPAEASGLLTPSEQQRLDEVAHNFLTRDRSPPTNKSIPWSDERIGRFHVERHVAQGSFGTVYQAFDTVLERTVALKIPKPEMVATAADRERVHREALAAASLNHHAIVRVFDGGSLPDGIPYICMEYCDGESLGQWLATHQHGTASPMTPQIAAKIIAIVAEGVHHAHDRGIVHRDLKPENILLEKPPASSTPSAVTIDINSTTRLQPRICDFGLAKLGLPSAVPQALHQASSIAGTFYYMAPEQIQGSVASSVDIFALGVILHFLLTGAYPFAGQDWDELLSSQSCGPSPVSLRNHKIPADLCAICLKCLQFRPDLRYASAHELAVDLRRFLAMEFVLARRPPIHERVWRYGKKNRLATALLGAISLGLIGTSWGFWNANRSLRESYLSQGQLALRNGEWDQARQLFRFEGNPSKSPTLADSRVGYVLSLLASDRTDECLRETRAALLTAGEREAATLQLIEGEALLSTAIDPEQAVKQISIAIDSELLAVPDSHYAKALTANNSPDARNELKRCLSVDGRHHRARRRLACLEFLSGDFAAAREHTQLLRTMFPEDWYPNCLDAMILGLSGEATFPEAEKQMAELQTKLGARRCRILIAEFETLRKFLRLSMTGAIDPSAPENEAIVAFGTALTDLWSNVKQVDQAEGSLSIGLARPILPCIYRSHQTLVEASHLVSKGRLADATQTMSTVCQAHPDSVSYYFLALAQIMEVVEQISHPDPQLRPDQMAQCRGFANAVQSFQRASLANSPYEVYRFDAHLQILIAYSFYPKHVSVPAEITQELETAVIEDIEQIDRRSRIYHHEGKPIVVLEMQPETAEGQGWVFPLDWKQFGARASQAALALKRPELALALVDKYRVERPADTEVLTFAAQTHIQLRNWQAAAEASQTLLATNALSEETRKQAELALAIASENLSQLVKVAR